jgi:hypothetical protein
MVALWATSAADSWSHKDLKTPQYAAKKMVRIGNPEGGAGGKQRTF